MNEPYFWDIGASLIIRKLIKPEINMMYQYILGFHCGSAGKESACSEGDLGSIPGSERVSGEGSGYHGQRTLAGCCTCGHKELDMTKQQTRFHRIKATIQIYFINLDYKVFETTMFSLKSL